MIQITERHMVGGRYHEHIASVKWKEIGTGDIGENTRAQMVAWLDEDDAHKAIAGDYPNDYAYVGAVHPQLSNAYIRTYADGDWTDNLLALPEY